MHAWFDLTAGVAGDMLLGALVDAGAPLAAVSKAVDAVAAGSVRLGVNEVTRAGQRASKLGVDVLVDDPPHRHWASLRREIAEADLHPETRARALAVFGRLAEAEGRVHGIDPDEVHFHEVGALDSIADIVGSCEALRQLGVTSVSASGIALGSGRIRAAHGDIPVPVPAVAELMVGWRVAPSAQHGWPPAELVEAPSTGSGSRQLAHHDHPAPVLTPGESGELATPTGVAFVRALAERCEALPAMEVSAVGVGAGGKDLPGRPNVVRVVLGVVSTGSTSSTGGDMTELMANVDDLDPRLWPGVLDACLRAGAADAWLVPIVMKKGRPAHTVHALVAPEAIDPVAEILLTHTTTLGVREVLTHRRVLDRSFAILRVLDEPLTVKIGSQGGRVVHAAAEFASLAEIADKTGRPQAEIAQRSASAIVEAGLVPGATVDGREGDPS